MSPVSGWRYLKMGECPECGDAEGLLQVPVVEGRMEKMGEKEILKGGHIPHFRPVCKRCSKKYTLDVLCSEHKLPVRVSDQRCQLCVK